VAQVRVTTTVNQAALRGWIEREVTAKLMHAGGRVRDTAKAIITAAGRVDTGQMRQGIVVEVVRVAGGQITVRITADTEQAGYQHEGTPQTILPRRARVLRFRPRGSAAFVFAPEVRGVHPANPTKPLPFLTDALDRLDLSDFT
jgi:hypothetical protein